MVPHASTVDKITKDMRKQIKNRRINKARRWCYSSSLTATKLETESKSPEFQTIHVFKTTHKKIPTEQFSSDLSVYWNETIPKDGWISVLFQWKSARNLFTFLTVHLSCSKGWLWFRIPGKQSPWSYHSLLHIEAGALLTQPTWYICWSTITFSGKLKKNETK